MFINNKFVAEKSNLNKFIENSETISNCSKGDKIMFK
jgi:hypothetical protein